MFSQDRQDEHLYRREKYGDVALSITCRNGTYCSPRYEILAAIEDYTSVEIALLPTQEDVPFARVFFHPSELGLNRTWDRWFESCDARTPVAGWVSQADLAKLRAALQKRMDLCLAGQPDWLEKYAPRLKKKHRQASGAWEEPTRATEEEG